MDDVNVNSNLNHLFFSNDNDEKPMRKQLLIGSSRTRVNRLYTVDGSSFIQCGVSGR